MHIRLGRISTLALLLLLLSVAVEAAAPSEVTLAVSGMHCESCAKGISSMLKRTDGVLRADVRYDTREAIVQYDASKTTPEKITSVIEDMGYKATVKK
jgi:mercuric ion binding protein